MIAEGISESGSEKRRRGRPRSWKRNLAEDLRRRGLSPSDCRCERSQMNNAYRLSALGPALRLLTAEERTVLFGATDDELRSGGTFPRGWDSAALELGRLLHGIDADDDTAADYLRVAVNARRDGVSWRAIRSHFRSLRLGERQGNALSLLSELARTIDCYRSRFPATTDQMIVGAVESLLEVVSEESAPEPGSPAENDLGICDP
jgi:hypothetical protein